MTTGLSIEQQYAQAMDEWSQSEDSVLWEATVGDGVDDADEDQAWIEALSSSWDSV